MIRGCSGHVESKGAGILVAVIEMLSQKKNDTSSYLHCKFMPPWAHLVAMVWYGSVVVGVSNQTRSAHARQAL